MNPDSAISKMYLTPAYEFLIKRFPSLDSVSDASRLGPKVQALRNIRFKVFAKYEPDFDDGEFIEVDAEVQGTHHGATAEELYVYGKIVGTPSGVTVFGDLSPNPHFLACVDLKSHHGKLITTYGGSSFFRSPFKN